MAAILELPKGRSVVLPPAKLENAQKKKVTPLVSLFAGSVAGGVEAATTYPFELVKTRLQLASSSQFQSRNPISVLANIARYEGIGSIYAGCSTLIVGTAFKASVRFLAFDSIKNALADESGQLTTSKGIAAGFIAGFFESVIAVTPTETIKTALIDDARGARRYNGFIHGTRTLFAERGFQGIYRGLLPTTIKQCSTSAVRMGSYNAMKTALMQRDIPMNTANTFMVGSVAGLITVYATQPFDTIKTRTQSAEARAPGMFEAFKLVLRENGVRGFWKGATPRLGRLVLSGGIVFSVYEQIASALTPGAATT